MSDLVLTVGGAKYGGWLEVEVTLSLEQLAGTFKISVSERWPDSGAARPIRPGQACTVQLAGETVITGYVDAVSPSYDDQSHTVAIWGRDKTADLVDCSVVKSGGEWLNQTLDRIAREVAEPFGVAVTVAGDVGDKFRRVKVQEGETAYELLDRLARQRGLLLWSDGLGHLVLGLPTPTRAPAAIRRGENVLSAAGENTLRDRCSEYIVKGQQSGGPSLRGTAASEPSARATDPDVCRYRPMVMVSESPGGIAEYRLRAAWERKVRAARGSRATWTVPGWGANGTLWRPNQIVDALDDWLGIRDPAQLLIATATYRKNDQGTMADIAAVRPGALDVLTEPEESEEMLLRPPED